MRDELARYDAIGNSVAGKYGFAMRGWVPNANKSQLESALAPLKGQVVYQFADAPTHHAGHVPVKLENNPVFRPFELLLGMFAPPAYGTFDPTWVLAVFFPLFFGFVIGDVGLGLVSLLVALFFRSKATRGQVLDLGPLGIRVPPKPLLNVATVLTWMSVWSIVFGFLYGEVFGTLGENLGLFHVVKEERVVGGVKVKTPISSLEASPKAKVEGEEKKAYEYEWLEDGKFPGAEHAREYHEERHHGLPIVLPRVKSEFANWMLILSLIPGILQVLFGWLVRARLGMVHHDGKHMWEGYRHVHGSGRRDPVRVPVPQPRLESTLRARRCRVLGGVRLQCHHGDASQRDHGRHDVHRDSFQQRQHAQLPASVRRRTLERDPGEPRHGHGLESRWQHRRNSRHSDRRDRRHPGAHPGNCLHDHRSRVATTAFALRGVLHEIRLLRGKWSALPAVRPRQPEGLTFTVEEI
ncbi:MAG: hypothetical protein HC933_01875 [Pleurocapsa sp. SU_196_0]|nr:hypothetical protein [Pleurocapsa sp. SU_196_0]